MAFPKFYERNDYVLDNTSDINITFEDLLYMNEEDFQKWIDVMREGILYSWDTAGCPLKSGLTEDKIVSQFSELVDVPMMMQNRDSISDPKIKKSAFETTDLLDESGKTIVVQNIQRDGSAVDQFFPTMMKTRINYSKKDNGYSVYDLFADPSKRNKLVTISRKCLKRDSFYYFSQTVTKDKDFTDSVSWLVKFIKTKPHDTDFWIDGKKKKNLKKVSSGYTQIESDSQVFLTKDEVIGAMLDGIIQPKHVTNLKMPLSDDYVYYIRTFQNGKRLFPHAFKAFRIGDIQIAVNFPPMTAKFLVQKYTAHIQNQDEIIWYDSSAGWGGRILGAMSYLRDGVKLHYVGNDPNPDNYVESLGKSRYEILAEFFNERIKNNRLSVVMGSEPINTYEIFRQGSETIGENPKFQKYKGKLDFVFTSPPYFAKEAYNDADTQSYKKFNQYELWRDGFLRPTLTTAVEYLRRDRYLIWNIADVQFDGEWLPLVKDSIDILESLGMKIINVNKMALMNMPGQNRIGEDGVPTSGSYAKILNSRGVEEYVKTEPFIVAYKE